MTKKNDSQQPTMILRGVDKALRNKFKSACALAGVSMTQAIQAWMREVVNDDKKLRGLEETRN